MKRVRFLRDEIYESEGRKKGPVYKAGSVHDFEDDFADRWLRRNAAELVDRRTPVSAAPDKSDEEPAKTSSPLGTEKRGGATPGLDDGKQVAGKSTGSDS